MKPYIVAVLLFLSSVVYGQYWQPEFVTGVIAYNGDLNQKSFSPKLLQPAIGINYSYISNDFMNFRFGLLFGQVTADDRYNTLDYLKLRNLRFKSKIIEFTGTAEMNLLDPETYLSYPYLLGGIGLFYFNPYTFDKDGKKTFLHPLSTEGEGFPEYPNRKKYSLIQPCIPLGAGFRFHINDKWEFCYEFVYRMIFTDYLDDVSRTYADLEIINSRKGEKAVELAYRKNGIPFSETGQMRGNSKIKDSYYFTGFKLTYNLNHGKSARKNRSKEKEEKKSAPPPGN